MLVAFGVGPRDGVVTTSPLEIIGTVETTFGDVTLTRDDGATIKVSVGDLVCRSDVIETAADSQIGIRLLDDSLFNVFSQARIELRELASESDGFSRSTVVAVTSGSFAFAAGRLANSGTLTIDTPLGSVRGHSYSKGFGILTIAALTFSMMDNAQAADPDATFVDDDTITYKDLQHGAFELITKEPVPRRIIVDDPGETIVLNRIGSSVSVSQVANSAARMEELQAAQRDVLANITRGATGSSTPPSSNSPSLQHINFTSDNTTNAPTDQLPPLTPIEIPLIVLPQPTLRLPTAPIEVDTVAFDEFTASSGTFAASSPFGAVLTYGLSGGTVGTTVLNGLTYDVSQTGPYGTLYLNSASGAYTFVPNNAAINALTSPTTASFVVTVSGDGLSASQTFNISILGVNDTATISGDVSGAVMEAGAVVNAASGTSTITGTLTSTDVDHPPNTFTAVSSPTKSTGGYGHFTMTSAGVWTYTLDNSNSTVQALNVGDTLTDTLTVTSIDGTPQRVTITIQGSNDAAVISGTTTGSVVEASCASPGTPIATGTLVATDVDDPVSTFVAVICPAASAQGYGFFTITSAGAWTYKLDNDNCTVQALNICDTRTDQFTVTTVDDTQQVVTITIKGTNDAAVISGTKTGSVLESGCISYGKPIATGMLAATDVDNPANTFTAVTSPAASDGGYGTFTMTATGLWTYTLDNNNCVVDALDVCDTLTDHFTVTTIDGTTQEVTITIRGASDAPNHFDYLATGTTVVSDPPFVYGTAGGDGRAGGGNVPQTIYGDAGDDALNGTGVNSRETATQSTLSEPLSVSRSMDDFRFVFDQTATSDSIHHSGIGAGGMARDSHAMLDAPLTMPDALVPTEQLGEAAETHGRAGTNNALDAAPQKGVGNGGDAQPNPLQASEHTHARSEGPGKSHSQQHFAVDGTPGSHGNSKANPHGLDDCFNFLNPAIERSGITSSNDLSEPRNHHECAATAAERGGAAAAADVSQLNHDAPIAGGLAGHHALHDLLV
ncbi:VCBS domain-containing protein [Bradyrhizobium sp. CCGB12]|uniref:VCBS domain-containing protein n=1 Tax=Bradyrhizobium sp. CCGB12 TaxID=2949632 RepID=UPI0020B18A3E|nr:VCBS domain-containing protein [Bradyrhizobium sp. CCGB12]MCP3387544.1 VCBS domain-containing protein [Bradyrhizobium sp. CCGB12]